jgi:hypothetical protein
VCERAHVYYCVCVCVKGCIYIMYTYIDRHRTKPREGSSSAPRPEVTWRGDLVRRSSVWEVRVEASSENVSSMLLSILPTTARPSKMRYLCVHVCRCKGR